MNRIATIDRATQAQLDRLASGDLSESERGNLLAWLDEDATRWRDCGLAFLEAQMWEGAAASALHDFTQGESAPPATIQPAGAATPLARGGGLRSSALTLTAVALAAFVAGALLARWLPLGGGPTLPVLVKEQPPQVAPSSGHTLIATVPVKTGLDAPFMLQVPVSTDPGVDPAAGAPSVSEYDRRKWERRGFEVIEEPRLLPARLPDGRPVMVPVNKIQLRFKGTPVS
jgi:hypothetical protein